MTLTHGADAARLRQIAAQLRGQAKLTSRIGAEGGARTSVISGVWEGPCLLYTSDAADDCSIV